MQGMRIYLCDVDRISSSIPGVLSCSVTILQLTRSWRQVDVAHGASESSLEDRAKKKSTIFQAGELNMNSSICNENVRSNLLCKKTSLRRAVPANRGRMLK